MSEISIPFNNSSKGAERTAVKQYQEIPEECKS